VNPKGIRPFLAPLTLSTTVVALVLALAELALRTLDRPKHPPRHVLCDCPYLYEQDRTRPEVSAQALRDRVFTIPKPAGVFRVLVLGDSVSYGVNVPLADAFPKVLERRLAGRQQRVEVVNAGVLGYTPYNELQYYLARGRLFQPDVVLVAFCMNDVVDPELHWSGTPREVPEVPPEAIPNPEYHRTHVQRLLGPSLPLIGRRSYLLRRVAELSDPRRRREWDDRKFAVVGGRRWPVYVTEEDDLGIQVLCDYETLEWRWLRGIYARLRTAVEQDHGRLALLVLPLAYELEDGYPFRPQEAFARYCLETHLPCLDLLEPLRQHRSEGVFFPPTGGGRPDVWHPTPRGHAIIARELDEFLTAAGLVPAPPPQPPSTPPRAPAKRKPGRQHST
jgi:GDSL-like Lipase/Acylhydrolase family